MVAFLENDSYVEIQVRTFVQGQICYMNFDYMSDVEGAQVRRQDTIQRWLDSCLPILQGMITDECTVLDIQGRQRGDFQSGMTTVTNLNVPGLVVAQALPAWDTFSFRKLPDNDGAYDRPGATFLNSFKYGRIPVSGVPESAVGDGLFEAGFADELNDFAVAVRVLVEPGGGDDTSGDLFLIMNRYVAGQTPPFQKRANVAEVIPNRIGTQLTRKR